MAKYRKVDNCGPVPYPDQSGRFLGDGEVVEDDENNDWSPIVPLGYIVEVQDDVTPDKMESKEELANAVEIPEESSDEGAGEETADMSMTPEKESEDKADEDLPEEKPKKKPSRRKRKKKEEPKEEELGDGMRSANDGGGVEEMDSSAPGESDS
jgi:outer membrane biosynthesis protein TonB